MGAVGPPASDPMPISLSAQHGPAISTAVEAPPAAVSTKAEQPVVAASPAPEASPPRLAVEGSATSQSQPRSDALAALRRIAVGRGGGGAAQQSASAGTIPLASGKVLIA